MVESEEINLTAGSFKTGDACLVIHSLSEYESCISGEIKKLRSEGYGMTETLFFRGHSNAALDLCPSIGRIYMTGDGRRISLIGEERRLIEDARQRAPREFRGVISPIEILAKCQHYGIPTRLLDITENSLVALYFSCQPYTPRPEQTNTAAALKQGEVIVFMEYEENVLSGPVEQAIAESYRFEFPSTTVGEFYDIVRDREYFLEARNKYKKNEEGRNGAVEDICNRCEDGFIFVRPENCFEREIAQQSAFILFPNEIRHNDPVFGIPFIEQIMYPVAQNRNIAVRIRVPEESKEEILRELRFSGITRDRLFPDGTDDIYVGGLPRKPERGSASYESRVGFLNGCVVRRNTSQRIVLRDTVG